MAKCVALFLLTLPLVYTLPTTITVNHNSKECLYDTLEQGEQVTLSLFILSGAELKGGLLLEGPVSPLNATTGADLQRMIDVHEHGKDTWGSLVKIEEDVDFEQLLPDMPDDKVRDDDDDNLWKQMDDDNLSEEVIKKNMEQRRKHAKIARERALEVRHRRAERMRTNKIRADGEPVQRTLTAKSAGWYRACVKGNWYQITAELEMRKETDLGSMDEGTGHVISYATKEELEETKYLEEDTASKEEGIKVEDFATVKRQLQNLRRLLSQIQQRQTSERHRLVVHAASNEHSHSRMVLSNIFETFFYMIVTGFQVYTIRKWFSGENSLLGR